MQVYFSAPRANRAVAAALTPVTLASLTAKQLAYLLVEPSPQLVVDCGGLAVPHPLGVCHFATQLLHLRQRGVCVWLCHVHPVVHRCLAQLELGGLFPLLGEEYQRELPRPASTRAA